jgi:hypothetical protein
MLGLVSRMLALVSGMLGCTAGMLGLVSGMDALVSRMLGCTSGMLALVSGMLALVSGMDALVTGMDGVVYFGWKVAKSGYVASAPDPREYPFFIHKRGWCVTEKKIPREGGVEMLRGVILLPPKLIRNWELGIFCLSCV